MLDSVPGDREPLPSAPLSIPSGKVDTLCQVRDRPSLLAVTLLVMILPLLFIAHRPRAVCHWYLVISQIGPRGQEWVQGGARLFLSVFLLRRLSPGRVPENPRLRA